MDAFALGAFASHPITIFRFEPEQSVMSFFYFLSYIEFCVAST